MATKVVDEAGRTWSVGRRWLPWPPKTVRLARRGELPRASPWRLVDGLDAASLFDDGPIGAIVAIALLLFFVVIAVPLVLIFGELLLLVLLLPLWILGRVLLRQPW